MFHWIAGTLILVWVASIAIIVTDEATSDSTEFSLFPDIKSSMAVATGGADAFKSTQSHYRGFFNICPLDDQDWKVVFSWSIVVPDVSTALPPLYLVVPADASQLNPEKQVLVAAKNRAENLDKDLGLIS
ncbi:hypothetical protein BBK82_14655 [Lentzea guizhouensis]|uniref:Uncharacterized protein n=1 Tax=Lentzea guizhouensis TaxID=1586287 RepID=A0A1B2HHD3_9PSEU|nr:hypothetical protein [Lentzea guizhouensis]ANZ37119.1 hypothetical protein BBK82_14655 [Lentzea guizhouensis]